MKQRIFRSICAVALASLVLLCACAVWLVYRQSTREGFQSLRADATIMAAGIARGGVEYLSAIRGYPGRITLVAADGTVLYDDREDPAAMDNHASRPEVAAALQNGAGQTQRHSETLHERTLYVAVRLADGRVLRLSMQFAGVGRQVWQFVPWLAAIALLLVGAAAFVARRQTARILKPVNELDLDAPFRADPYEELSPLLRKIAAQKQEIDAQVQALERRQEEFSAITQSMQEGLVVVDHAGAVMTLNQSARRILGLGDAPQAPTVLLEVNRSLAMEQAVRQALAGQRVEQVLELNRRAYRLLASPCGPAQEGRGAVLLLMDDTEKLQAEQTRREFSANVSHELKTPLTSISGYAEIIRDGVARAEDIPGFAGKIYDESARLIALVNDIIKLSRLDEKQVQAEFETLDLLPLVHRTVQALQKKADEKGVGLSASGEKTEMDGVTPILLEILFNLVDNAIRCTDAGGRVEVAAGRAGGDAFLRVTDNGIGIPTQHQAYVFERFYRVDKSHAREGGGTGLGLSIVKRGALFHGGRVDLVSAPGQGSTFTVWLPVRHS